MEKYILQRRDELVGPSTDLTQAQLLGDEPAAPKAKADRKGFA